MQKFLTHENVEMLKDLLDELDVLVGRNAVEIHAICANLFSFEVWTAQVNYPQ